MRRRNRLGRIPSGLNHLHAVWYEGIKSIFIITFFPILVCSACSSDVSTELTDDVSSAVWMGKKFRDNPQNVGGNENLAYEPSQFKAHDELSAGMAPVWMLDSSVAHKCLTLIIAADQGFNESNWISFFHGVPTADIPIVKNRVFEVGPREYSQLLGTYPCENLLSYNAFRGKLSAFEGVPLQSLR
jgi:hypothetical protein